MMRRIRNAALVFAISICWIGFAGADDSRPENPRVRLDAGKEIFVMELDPAAAPATVFL